MLAWRKKVAPAAQPINQTVVEAAVHAINNACDSCEWIDFAQAIAANREAKRLLKEVLWAAGSGPKDDARLAFGIGMVAGMTYSHRKVTGGAPQAV